MLRDPLVSVVINNYNYGRFLSETVDSALAQTYSAVEIVVVDDGSSDDSRDVIERYGSSIRSVLKPNGGQGSAFTAGILAASGEIIALLDSDDTWHPEKISVSVAALRNAEVACGARPCFLRHNLIAIGDDSVSQYSVGSLVPGIGQQYTHPPVPPTTSLVRRFNAPSSAMVFTADAAKRLVPLPSSRFRISADAFLYTLLPTLGATVDLPDILGEYRLHPNNHYAGRSALRARLKTELELVVSLRERNIDPILPVHVVHNWSTLQALDPSLSPLRTLDAISHLWADTQASIPRRFARIAKHIAAPRDSDTSLI